MVTASDNELNKLNVPEIFKEHKCCYCNRLYMCLDTYGVHLQECVQKKLINFVCKLNYFIGLKDNRNITPNSFIRHMIESIKEIVNGMSKHCNDFIVPDLVPIKKEQGKYEHDFERIFDFIEKYSPESSKSISPSQPLVNSSIRCEHCDINIETLNDLEIHNYKFHMPIRQSVDTGNLSPNGRLLALFASQEGIVDVTSEELNDFRNIDINKAKETNVVELRSFLKAQQIPPPPRPAFRNDSASKEINVLAYIDEKSTTLKKTIRCKVCFEQFLTITHLDMHMNNRHKKF